MKMRIQKNFSLCVLVVVGCFVVCSEGEDMTTQCGQDFQKLTTCLSYATGKATTPTKECCASVKDIKDSDPKCLCFIIQQTHNGSDMIKSMGIQEAKLLQLPSACQLQNASVSYCPKLLGISPSSPDAAIFGNSSSSKATPAPGTSSGSTTSAPDKADNGSNGRKHEPYLVGSTLVIAMAILLCGLPAGFATM